MYSSSFPSLKNKTALPVLPALAVLSYSMCENPRIARWLHLQDHIDLWYVNASGRDIGREEHCGRRHREAEGRGEGRVGGLTTSGR